MPVFVITPEQHWSCGCATFNEQLVTVCIVHSRQVPPPAGVEIDRVRHAPTCFYLEQLAAAEPSKPGNGGNGENGSQETRKESYSEKAADSY